MRDSTESYYATWADNHENHATLSDTYHHFEQPRAMLISIHRALRDGGSLIVIDFERVEGKSSDWVLGHVRADKKQVVHEIEAAGFRLAADAGLRRENFYLRFEKGATGSKK